MTQMQITLPEPAKVFVEEQVKTGRYQSASEFLTELIERARKKAAAEEKLAELIREGEESGEGVEYSDEWWERRGEEIRAEAERRRSA